MIIFSKTYFLFHEICLDKCATNTIYYAITNSHKNALCKSTNVIHRAVFMLSISSALIGVPIWMFTVLIYAFVAMRFLIGL